MTLSPARLAVLILAAFCLVVAHTAVGLGATWDLLLATVGGAS